MIVENNRCKKNKKMNKYIKRVYKLFWKKIYIWF